MAFPLMPVPIIVGGRPSYEPITMTVGAMYGAVFGYNIYDDLFGSLNPTTGNWRPTGSNILQLIYSVSGYINLRVAASDFGDWSGIMIDSAVFMRSDAIEEGPSETRYFRWLGVAANPFGAAGSTRTITII